MSSSVLKIGIVGLPNVGKSTLFNALRQAQGKLLSGLAQTGNYPFTTVEPNIGVVAVSDDRLVRLSELVRSEEKMSIPPPIVPAVVEFVDIAGLVKGAHKGEGLGNQFLSYIREVDAIIHVLRDFQDENVVRAGAENPDADRLAVETELGLADLQTLEKLVLVQEKEAGVTGSDPTQKEKLKILVDLRSELDQGRTLGKYHIGDERLRSWFEHLPLLSLKPVLYVYNVSEEAFNQLSYDPLRLVAFGGPRQSRVGDEASRSTFETGNKLMICAKLEEELVDLSEEERMEYLKSVGVQETGLERLIKKAYQLLGLISFLTAGKKEVRAWTVRAGETALRASSVIHTDFMKGFIRAQVIEYEKLIEAGSFTNAKAKGWIRTEGKDYGVKDGDVIEFLVST